MPQYTEEDRAALAKQRGQLASQITDPKQRQQFIAQQGDEEAQARKSGQDLDDLQRKQAEKTYNQTNRIVALGSYKKGGTIPKTGPYKLHKGEYVVPKKHAAKVKKIMPFFGN